MLMNFTLVTKTVPGMTSLLGPIFLHVAIPE